MSINNISGVEDVSGTTFNGLVFNLSGNGTHITMFNGRQIVIPEPMSDSVRDFIWSFNGQNTVISQTSEWNPLGSNYQFTSVVEDLNNYVIGNLNGNFINNFATSSGWFGSWFNGTECLSSGQRWTDQTNAQFPQFTGTRSKGHNMTNGDNTDTGISPTTNAKETPEKVSPFDPANFNPAFSTSTSFKHLYRESSNSNSGATTQRPRYNYHISRTPGRVFTYSDATTNKYFAFHYHANVAAADGARMAANMQEVYYTPEDMPGNDPIGFLAGIYASPSPTAIKGDPGVTFIGGILEDDRTYFNGAGNQDAPFRTKILGIPNAVTNPALWETAVNNTLYFFIVTPPHEQGTSADVCFANVQCQEWLNDPDDLLQLRRDSDDRYDLYLSNLSTNFEF